MNCSHNCKMCGYAVYQKHFKNFVIKTLVFVNMISFMYWCLLIDYIISWQPYAIMILNLSVTALDLHMQTRNMEGDFL